MQFRIFGRVITISFYKKDADWKFSVRGTKIEPPVMGIRSDICGNDIYTDQMHIGIFDIDDNLTLQELVKKIKEVQDKFPFVGNGYVYETSPSKFSFHFYNLATYWDWMKVVHFCKDVLDKQYVKWRLLRDSMVMRFSPKTNGHVPKLVAIIKSPNPKPEIKEVRDWLWSMIGYENRLKEIGGEKINGS